MPLASYKTSEGKWIDPSGTVWESDYDLVQGGLLGFCCCGTGALELVRDGLSLLDRRIDLAFDEWKSAVLERFGRWDSAEFFFYWADQKGFCAHGSSIPGRLTPEGEEMLLLCDEAIRGTNV